MMNGEFWKAQSTVVSATLEHIVLSCIRKQTEQVIRNKLVSSVLSWPLLQFLPLGSCFEFLPCPPSMILLLVLVFYHCSMKQTKTSRFCGRGQSCELGVGRRGCQTASGIRKSARSEFHTCSMVTVLNLWVKTIGKHIFLTVLGTPNHTFIFIATL